jgi:hypothetical protein
VLEPERPLEPPVAEQLRVVGRAHQALAALGGVLHGLLHQPHEVGGLQADLLGGNLGVVHLLGAEVMRGVGDAPEAQAAGVVVLVELQVIVVARVAGVPAPDLKRRARIADERHRRAGPAARGDAVGRDRFALTAAGTGSPDRLAQLDVVFIEEDRLPGGNQVRVGHEVPRL